MPEASFVQSQDENHLIRSWQLTVKPTPKPSSDGDFIFRWSAPIFRENSCFQTSSLSLPKSNPRFPAQQLGDRFFKPGRWSSICGTTMHPVLPPCTWAFRAMVYKHDCILLEHLVSPPCLSQKQVLQVCGGCVPPWLQCLGWHDLPGLPCSWGQGTLLWLVPGLGQELLKETPLAIPRIPSTGLPAWTLSKIAMSFGQDGTSQVGFTRCKRVIF